MNEFIEGILDFVKDILNSFFNAINSIFSYILFLIKTYPVELLFLLILVFILSKFIRDLIVRSNMAHKSVETEINLREKLGYIILIFGKIRVGKTTLMSALAHVIVKVLRYNAYSKCEHVKSIILNVDWLEIDKLINELYEKNVPVKDASDIVFNNFETQLSKSHYSYVNREITYESLMLDYIEARYALIRNNYIYSLKEQVMYCRITNNYSLVYDPKWTRWKDAWQDRDYRFPKYCVILWDEKNMDPNKKALGYHDAYKEDDGTPEFLRAFGNSSKETRYLIFTAQEAKNWVTLERRLVSSIVEVRGRKKINIWSLSRFIINRIIKLTNLIYRIFIFFKFTKIRKDNYINNYNVFRKILKWLDSRLDYLDYKCYLRFDIALYDNMDDLGKKNTSTSTYCDELSLYFPTFYAWGNIDTWQLSYLDDELIKRSEHTIFEVQEGQRFLTQDECEQFTKSYLDRTVKIDAKDKKKRQSLNLPVTEDEEVTSAF